MKTLIVGLGNPILGDDGVGWKVAEAVQAAAADEAQVVCLSVGGLGLMEHLIGYDHVILIDAFITDREAMGSILVRRLDDLPNYSAYHITNAHDTSLQQALQLGQKLGAHLPEKICVVGIAIRRIRDFGDELSPPVAQAVESAAHIVLNFLKQGLPVSLSTSVH